MGAVKELMIDTIHNTAKMSGKDEDELLREWNSNLQRRPDNMESIEDFVVRHRDKKKTKK